MEQECGGDIVSPHPSCYSSDIRQSANHHSPNLTNRVTSSKWNRELRDDGFGVSKDNAWTIAKTFLHERIVHYFNYYFAGENSLVTFSII